MTKPHVQIGENDSAAIETVDPQSSVIAAADPMNLPRQSKWRQLGTNVVLPLLVMALAAGAGYLKHLNGSDRAAQAAAVSSVAAATAGTIELLSYRPDTAETTLMAASDRLTGHFRDSYTSLVNDVVAPGAKERRISATATVPAASSVSATAHHAVVLVFVNQSVIVGDGAPSATSSAVQVSLDKIDDRWLISGFDPK
ncbi:MULTISPECIES: hypothetical protein [Mycolicibacterium]|uniref:hypothetical protein n=1 Tax=Mycolicibacterium TaxID=1866885 RepID=UPI000A80853F|nr:hypothetical protein [Mycolicibacterium fortuitum]NOP99237.1 hypothetical protein [Mycolicibacterium fortuitum]